MGRAGNPVIGYPGHVACGMKTESLTVSTFTCVPHPHPAPPRGDDCQCRSVKVLRRASNGPSPLLWDEVRDFAEWLSGNKARQINGKAGLCRPTTIDVRHRAPG